MAPRKRKPSPEAERQTASVLAGSRPGHALVFHDLGSDGSRWPLWLHAYEKSCGAYVIRDKGSKSVLYVGSSTSRLYDTVTRHFQSWKRQKTFWRGMRGNTGHDPGMTYNRSRCEVAIRLSSCGEERDEEARLIGRLAPRDNLVERPDGGDVPF